MKWNRSYRFCFFLVIFSIFISCTDKGPGPDFDINGLWVEVNGDSKIQFNKDSSYVLVFNPPLSTGTTYFKGEKFKKIDHANFSFTFLLGATDLQEVEIKITSKHILGFRLAGKSFRFIKSEDQSIDIEDKSLNDIPAADIPKIPPPPDSLGDETGIFAYDEAPEPIGGIASIKKNLIYPDEARKAGIEGVVFIETVINETGEIIETKIVKSLNKELDDAALEAVKSVKWNPAKNEGKPVKARVVVPVRFSLK